MNPVHSFRHWMVVVSRLLVMVTLTVSIGSALVGNTMTDFEVTGGATCNNGMWWSD